MVQSSKQLEGTDRSAWISKEDLHPLLKMLFHEQLVIGDLLPDCPLSYERPILTFRSWRIKPLYGEITWWSDPHNCLRCSWSVSKIWTALNYRVRVAPWTEDVSEWCKVDICDCCICHSLVRPRTASVDLPKCISN